MVFCIFFTSLRWETISAMVKSHPSQWIIRGKAKQMINLGLHPRKPPTKQRWINLLRLSIFFRVIGCSFLRVFNWLTLLDLCQANETENEVSSDSGFKFQGGDYGIDGLCWEQNKCLFRLLYPDVSNIWVSVISPDGSLLLGEGYRWLRENFYWIPCN